MVPNPDEIRNPPEATLMAYLTNLELYVIRNNPDLGEQDIFMVSGDRHEFFFREYPDERIGGESVWRIVQWRDKAPLSGNLALTPETTWGRIKSIYADLDPDAARPNTSAQNLLHNLKRAYVERDLELYASLFDPVEFLFKFAPVDIVGEDPLPPIWGWR